MRRILKDQPERTLRRRVLRKMVLAEHLKFLKESPSDSRWWSEHPVEHKAKFRRRLRRARKALVIATEGKAVVLAERPTA